MRASLDTRSTSFEVNLSFIWIHQQADLVGNQLFLVVPAQVEVRLEAQDVFQVQRAVAKMPQVVVVQSVVLTLPQLQTEVVLDVVLVAQPSVLDAALFLVAVGADQVDVAVVAAAEADVKCKHLTFPSTSTSTQ